MTSRNTYRTNSLWGTSNTTRRNNSGSNSGLWARTTNSSRTSWGRGTSSGTSRSATTGNTSTTSYSPNKFGTCRNTCTAMISSLRNINQQFSGTGKVTAFSPNTATKWINFVNDGCNIYKFTQNDFCRHFGTQTGTTTTATAFRILRNRFGNGIKGVTRGKGSNWLVAATTKITARPFSTYTWK